MHGSRFAQFLKHAMLSSSCLSKRGRWSWSHGMCRPLRAAIQQPYLLKTFDLALLTWTTINCVSELVLQTNESCLRMNVGPAGETTAATP